MGNQKAGEKDGRDGVELLDIDEHPGIVQKEKHYGRPYYRLNDVHVFCLFHNKLHLLNRTTTRYKYLFVLLDGLVRSRYLQGGLLHSLRLSCFNDTLTGIELTIDFGFPQTEKRAQNFDNALHIVG